MGIGFGTDLIGPLEDEQLNGLRLQAEVDGIWTALASATSVNAALIGRPDLGRVAEGATADLLILDGIICDDPSVVWSPDSWSRGLAAGLALLPARKLGPGRAGGGADLPHTRMPGLPADSRCSRPRSRVRRLAGRCLPVRRAGR